MRLPAPEILKGCAAASRKRACALRPDGQLSSAPHPAGLGAALTHPHITTDFSESQLELITGPHQRVDACLEELTEIHKVVYRAISSKAGDEVLWCSSMPCNLPADDAIPIGRYGTSNVGRAKTVYRTGLTYRYGPAHADHLRHPLQPVDPGDDERAVLRADRNFRRRSWLLLYLFGASPTVCSTFVAGRKARARELAPGTMYAPHGPRCAWGGSATRATRSPRSR